GLRPLQRVLPTMAGLSSRVQRCLRVAASRPRLAACAETRVPSGTRSRQKAHPAPASAGEKQAEPPRSMRPGGWPGRIYVSRTSGLGPHPSGLPLHVWVFLHSISWRVSRVGLGDSLFVRLYFWQHFGGREILISFLFSAGP